MYRDDNPLISGYMRESDDGFFRGAMFAVLSIRKSIVRVPVDLDAIIKDDLSPLYGWKLDSHAFLVSNTGALRTAMLAAPDNVARIMLLSAVPGLGVVKAAFVLQLMGYDVACLDSRNVAREGRAPRAFRSDGKRKETRAFRRKVERYLSEVEGKAQAYWDAWCHDVAKVYKKTAEEISGLHLAILPDDYVPF